MLGGVMPRRFASPSVKNNNQMKKYFHGQFRDGLPYTLENPYYTERVERVKEVLRTFAGLLLIAVIVGVEVLIIINH